MGKKRISKRGIAVFMAAACMAGNMPYARTCVYAGENVAAAENLAEGSGQGMDGVQDGNREESGAQENAAVSGTDTAAGSGEGVSAENTSAGGADTDSASHAGMENSATAGDSAGVPADDTDSSNVRTDADSAGTEAADNAAGDGTDIEAADSVAEDSRAAEDSDGASGSGDTDDAEADNADDVYEDGADDMPAADGEDDETMEADADTGTGTDGTQDGVYTDGNGVAFTYQGHTDGTADICRIEGYQGKDLAVPKEIDGLRVTRVMCAVGGSLASLTIPETITYICDNAFGGDIGALYYNAEKAGTSESGISPFQSARIGNFVLGKSVRSIGGRMFQNADFLQDCVTISMPEIGEDTFSFAEFNTLILTDDVKEIHSGAFKFCKIQELRYDTNAAHIMENQLGSVFSSASIYALEIGSSVKELPAYAFHWADMCFEELTLRVEKVGDYAFSNAWKAEKGYSVDLTVTDSVKYMGAGSFQHCQISGLELDASVETGDAHHVSGIFSMAQIESLHISDRVESIPAYMFDNADFTRDELALNMAEIGECAFYGDGIRIGKLAIGENVASIGRKAFSFCSIDSLEYNAARAEVTGAEYAEDGPFYKTPVGSVEIGGSVTALPGYLLREAKLNLGELSIPESVSSIGDYAVCGGMNRPEDISIGTLTISGNVRAMGRNPFGYSSIDRAVIHALEAQGGVDMIGDGQPECANVEIHGGSEYYRYFTKKTDRENVTILCSDFETEYGEPYYDGEKGCYVTPVTESCVSCGYEKTGEEYGDAHAVIFLDSDGTELSRQYVRTGKDAVPPQEPERTGWRFTGWDKEYTGVTADLTVTAQYEIQKFTVTFMDGETVLASQEVEYGSDAQAPESPSRPDCEWGKWKFSGWEGSYKRIMQDEIVYAQFTKVLNEYEVTFHDADGNVLSTQAVTHGGSAILPEAPVKEASAQHVYIFSGWDGDTQNITGNASFRPVYETRTRTYTVTFMNGGTVLDMQEVEYGRAASAPADPVKEADGRYVYKFAGWDSDYSSITKDMEIHALFDAEESGNGTDDKDKDDSGSGTDKDKDNSGSGTDKDKDKGESGDGTDKDKDKDNSGNEADKNKDESGNGTDKDKGESDNGTDKGKDKPDTDKGKDESDNGTDKGKDDSGNGTDKDKDDSGSGADKDKGDSDSEADKNTDDSGNGTDKDKDNSGNGTDGGKDASGNGKGSSGNGAGTVKPAPGTGGQKVKPVTPAEGSRPAVRTGNKTGNIQAGIAQELPTKREKGQQMPRITKPDADTGADETETKPLQESDGKGVKETVTGDEGDGKENREPKGRSFKLWRIPCMVSAIAVLASLLALLLLYLRGRKRKVCGAVLEADGRPMIGAHVILTAGTDTLETHTDRDGRFSFDSLEKSRYTLDISRSGGQEILFMDIRMDGRDEEEIFKISSSHCSHIEPSYKKGCYVVNITA